MNEHVDRRAFTYAVGASLALHALLLGLRVPQSAPPPTPSVTITAHLAEPEAAPPSPPVAQSPPPLPKVEKPKPPPKVVRPRPAPPKPSAITVAPVAPSEPVEAGSEPAPPPVPAPAPAPPVAAPGPVAVAPAAPPPAPDPSMLIAQYRSQVIGAAARYKRYPLRARDNGWEGDVVVRLEIGSGGELAEAKVKRSSGHDALDQQALEMFRLAAPQVLVPPALRGRAFGFDVRAVYSLRD